MKFLLKVSAAIDWINDRFGGLAAWAVILSCFISCINAVVRFGLNIGSNGWLEIQWYLFAACVMLGAAHVFKVNEHVRVDVLYGRYPTRTKVYVDLVGIVFFMIPVMSFLLYLSVPLFWRMFVSGEMSPNAGGLIRWPAMLLLPIGFTQLIAQGLSEAIKRIAWLTGQYEMNLVYERPLQ
jgi:TRAP-type mannitol/chloroaromatic compound transport system permease small subunit